MTSNRTYREKARAVLLAAVMVLSMVAMTATFAGGAAASQHDVDVSFSDETAGPGDTVQVSFDIDPANDQNAEVGAYDVEINYDSSVLNFVEATGEDLADPTASEPSDGTITMNAGQAQGEPVPLTAATLTFEVASDASGSATISLDDANSQFNDPVNTVTFESQDGSVTVSQGANFDVTGLQAPSEADEGEQITVEGTVENTGSQSGTQDVDFMFDGSVLLTEEDVQLDAGESTTVTFQPTLDVDPGTYTHGVSTDDDQATAQITVNEVQASVTFGDQPSLNGNSVLLDQVSGSQGQQVAVWSVDENGNPDSVLGNRGLPSGSETDFVVDLDTPIEESQDLVVAVHDTTDPNDISTGNILASSSAEVSFVQADDIIRDPGTTPTQWQGQVLVLEGDFVAGNDYQVREVSGSGTDRTVGGLAREVRAFNDGELIVFTDILGAGLYITETEQQRYANGDELADDLSNEPGFGYEIAVQNLRVSGVQSQVTRNQTFNVGLIDSVRSSYDIDVTAVNEDGEAFGLTTLTNVADREQDTAITARYVRADGSTAPLPVGEYTLLFNATDTTASDAGSLEVVPELDEEVTISAPSPESDSYARGDIIPITLDFQGTDTGTLTFGDRGGQQNVEISVTVRDANGDGTATILLNTFQIGDGPVTDCADSDATFDQCVNGGNVTDNTVGATNRNHGFYATGPDQIVGDAVAWGEDPNGIDILGGSQGGAIIFPQSYALTSTAGADSYKAEDQAPDDNSVVRIEEASSDGITTWTAPGLGENTIDPEFASDIQDGVDNGIITPTDGAVAAEDFLVLEIGVSGLEGLMHEAVLQDPDLTTADFLDRSIDHLVTEEFFAAQNLTDRSGQFQLLSFAVDTQESVASAESRVEPNRELNPVILDIQDETSGVVAGTDDSGNLDTFYIPLRLPPGQQLTRAGFYSPSPDCDQNNPNNPPFPDYCGIQTTGNEELQPGLFFNSSFSLSPTASDQGDVVANDPLANGVFDSVDEWDYLSPIANIDESDPLLTVPQEDGVEITGTTQVAAGTNLSINLITTPAEDPPFFKPHPEVFPEYNADGPNTWSITDDFADFDVGTEFDASIRRTGGAGLITPTGDPIRGVVGEARNVDLFTFEEQRAADTRSGGQSVTVANFSAPYDSIIQILDADGNQIGLSNVLEGGEDHSRVAISLSEDIEDDQAELTAVAWLANNAGQPSETYKDDAGEDVTRTANVIVNEPAPANLRISNVSPRETQLDEPESVTIDVTVENTGDQTGNQAVEAVVGGEVVTSQQVQNLGGGFDFTAELTIPADVLSFGQSTLVTFQTENDDSQATISVAPEPEPPEPAEFSVSELDPRTASLEEPGATVTVSATITNDGEAEETKTVSLTLDGEALASEDVTLAGGESTEVSFDADTSELSFGTDYEHAITTEDDSAVGVLSIGPEPTPTPTETATPTESDSDDGAGFGIVVAMLAFLAAALLAVRRRTDS